MNNPCINSQLVLELQQDEYEMQMRWMDGDGGDAAVVDGDRCLGLPDLSRVKMDPGG